MDSFKFHDVSVEKSNSAAKHSRIQKIASFFRFLELLIFFVALTKYSPQLLSSLKLSGDYFRSIPAVSSRSVFLVGNAIVVILFFISGQFSGERSADFYDEYVEKCRSNQQKRFVPAEGKVTMSRSRSVVVGEERRRELRRSASEKIGKKKADEMSGEEFRRTVEAFIARQQKCLREEEEFSFKA